MNINTEQRNTAIPRALLPEIHQRKTPSTSLPGLHVRVRNSLRYERDADALRWGAIRRSAADYGLCARIVRIRVHAQRGRNESSWLYSIRPLVRQSGRFGKVDAKTWRTAPCFGPICRSRSCGRGIRAIFPKED